KGALPACSNLPLTQALPGSAKLIRGATAIYYPGGANGITATQPDRVNADFVGVHEQGQKTSKQVEFLRADHKQPLGVLRPSEADHIAVVVADLKSSKAVAGVGKWAVHRYGVRDVLRIKRVGIGSVNVRIPSRPFMAG